MARSRNIKPGFCQNEYLAELPYETRLAFVCLPMFADREGRLEDRPKKIKMQIFPADNLDMDGILSELHGAGFILRYQVENHKYIQIVNFSRHQNPHVNEKPSDIPEPPDSDTCTVQAPDKHSCNRADSFNPHTDSLEVPAGEKIPRCPHGEIISLYREILVPPLPDVVDEIWPDSHSAKQLTARWRAHEKHQSLDFWRGYFEAVSRSPWHMGQNDSGWTADLHWLVKKSNFGKMVQRWVNEK